MKDNPKFMNIGDYWNEETIDKIVDLLCEYHDFFPTTFSEVKGIIVKLREMRIPLKLDVKLVNKIPYRLNPLYKQKVKEEIYIILEVGITEPVVESEWISLMVIQNKKTSGIDICVDLSKLNDAFLHDLLPTPFTDEVLQNVGGYEAYSFINGFFGYHQIKIVKEDRHKTTFMMEWVCYQYTIMPFGLKNPLVIFFLVIV
jgi:hypothetical protein